MGQETADLTRHEDKGDKTRRGMASEQQINKLHGQIIFAADQPFQPTRTLVHHPLQQAEAVSKSRNISHHKVNI